MNTVYILDGSIIPFIWAESSALCSGVREAAICAESSARCSSVSRESTSAPVWSCPSCSGVRSPMMIPCICSSDTIAIMEDCISACCSSVREAIIPWLSCAFCSSESIPVIISMASDSDIALSSSSSAFGNSIPVNTSTSGFPICAFTSSLSLTLPIMYSVSA